MEKKSGEDDEVETYFMLDLGRPFVGLGHF